MYCSFGGRADNFPQVSSDDFGLFEHNDSRHQSVMWFGNDTVVIDIVIDAVAAFRRSLVTQLLLIYNWRLSNPLA